MKQEYIKVIIKEVGKKHEVKTIKNELKELQGIVGGLIDVFNMGDNIDIVFNNEGKLIDLEPNISLWEQDYIAGNLFFCGVDLEEGDFCSLSDEQIKNVENFITCNVLIRDTEGNYKIPSRIFEDFLRRLKLC